MAKHKLESVRKLYEAAEQQLGRELKALAHEQDQHRTQTQALSDLLSQCRDEHQQARSMSAAHALRFKRFYQRVVSTLAAQTAVGRRLEEVHSARRRAWLEAHRRKLGIERVMDKQIAQSHEQARRRERRSQRSAAGEGWSTLKKED